MDEINSFHGEYRFLSNFYSHSLFHYMGFRFATAEHAYQWTKTTDIKIREEIRRLDSPGEAKRMGQLVPLRNNWESIKIDVMKIIVFSKFSQSESLMGKLLSTDALHLIEGNTWHDNFWGECECDKCRRKVKRNYLGVILMETRMKLRIFGE